MRIAINTRFLLANRLEGIGRFTYEVAQRLVERRPDDEFIFIFDRPFDPRFTSHDRIKAIVAPPPARHPVLWYLWFEWAVPYVLKKHKVDAFISMDGYCSLRTRVPTVMVSHDIAHVHYPSQIPSFIRAYYNYFVPRYMDRADQLITVSNFCKEDFIQEYNIEASKISVACNGISPEFVPLSTSKKEQVREKYSQNEDYFFYIGAIHPRKNIVRLIQAFDQFKEQTSAKMKLLIAGRFAWQTSEIKTVYEEAKHKADIQFLGYVSDEELPLLVGSAFALTYVSLFEGFGVPLIEAMQAKVPVITSNVSSMIEVGGNAALLVDPTSIEAISTAMQKVYDQPSMRESMIEKGLVHCQQFTWEIATDIVEQALESCLNNK